MEAVLTRLEQLDDLHPSRRSRERSDAKQSIVRDIFSLFGVDRLVWWAYSGVIDPDVDRRMFGTRYTASDGVWEYTGPTIHSVLNRLDGTWDLSKGYEYWATGMRRKLEWVWALHPTNLDSSQSRSLLVLMLFVIQVNHELRAHQQVREDNVYEDLVEDLDMLEEKVRLVGYERMEPEEQSQYTRLKKWLDRPSRHPVVYLSDTLRLVDENASNYQTLDVARSIGALVGDDLAQTIQQFAGEDRRITIVVEKRLLGTRRKTVSWVRVGDIQWNSVQPMVPPTFAYCGLISDADVAHVLDTAESMRLHKNPIEWGLRTCCILCGRMLQTQNSINGMIGPSCGRIFGERCATHAVEQAHDIFARVVADGRDLLQRLTCTRKKRRQRLFRLYCDSQEE